MASLLDAQRSRLTARSQARFEQDPTWTYCFNTIRPDTVIPLVFRHYAGYLPPNPTEADIMRRLGGGYEQECLTATLGLVLARDDECVVVLLETPLMLSHRCGPTLADETFALYEGGMVNYFLDDGPRPWSHHAPRWEPMRLPLVPPMMRGI